MKLRIAWLSRCALLVLATLALSVFAAPATYATSRGDAPSSTPNPFANDSDQYSQLLDSFALQSNGTPYGSVAYATGMTHLGQAVMLTPGAHVRYAVPAWYIGGAANPQTQGSVELWVRPAAYGDLLNFNWYATATRPENGHVLVLRLTEVGHVSVGVWNPESDFLTLTGTTTIRLGSWTHLAFTWSPQGSKLYVNGRVEAASSQNLYPDLGGAGASFYAYLNGWGSGSFAGMVDDLHLSTVQRSNATILAHATGVLDTFNQHDGALDRVWYGPLGLGGYQINGSQLAVAGGGPIYWRGPMLGKSQGVFVTVVQPDPQGQNQDLLLKVQGNVPDWESGAIGVSYNAQARQVWVETYRPRQADWTRYPAIVLTLRAGDRFGALACADGTVTIERNGEVVAVVTLNRPDQAFFNARGGRAGLYYNAAGAALLDDFGAGTLQ